MLLSNNFHITPTKIRRPYNSNKFYLLNSLTSFNTSLASKSHRKVPNPLSSSVSTGRLAEENSSSDFVSCTESEIFSFDGSLGLDDLKKRFDSPGVEVKELEELPEQWRRSKLAWLCKELPAHRLGTFTRVLNAQRKWIRQEDCTYVTVHCTRIRENEAAFRVYKWMMQQHWFRFDFALATKLADFMGKERKFLKCREIFDDIMNQGLIPNESTFHILIVAYLSSSSLNELKEACSIYNRMIHLGGYNPRLSLHNSLFRALVSETGPSCKDYLKEAEFIFHNLKASRLDIHDDIYSGLIWIHSYQDIIDKERIESLREEMKAVGIQESIEVLVSILRACSKEGDVTEAEKTWTKILNSNNNKCPSQAFVYLMEVYSKAGKPMKSLEIFRGMQVKSSSNTMSYYKIIEILCKARETELAESLMSEFINSGMKPLTRSFLDLMDMYSKLKLHDKLESTFLICMERCRPNRATYNMYLDSLVEIGNLEKAEEILNHMHGDESIGVDNRSCNTILRGYLKCGSFVKAEKIYDLMRQMKYEIESSSMEKLEYFLSLSPEDVKKPVLPKLSKEQREMLLGLLMGGLKLELDEDKKNYAIQFVFRENFKIHLFLKRHIYDRFREWLPCIENPVDDYDDSDIPYRFTTVSHSYFKFYADQFWPEGQPTIPKLIHRWVTPRVLAYWYMYGGYKTSLGDVLVKVKVCEEDDVLRIVENLKAKGLDCRVKRKGSIFWIGFLGKNAEKFWKVIEPFILVDLKEFLEPGIEFLKESDSDGKASDFRGGDGKTNLL